MLNIQFIPALGKKKKASSLAHYPVYSIRWLQGNRLMIAWSVLISILRNNSWRLIVNFAQRIDNKLPSWLVLVNFSIKLNPLRSIALKRWHRRFIAIKTLPSNLCLRLPIPRAKKKRIPPFTSFNLKLRDGGKKLNAGIFRMKSFLWLSY